MPVGIINHAAFDELEGSLVDSVTVSWIRAWAPVQKRISAAVERNDWNEAHELAEEIDTDAFSGRQRGRLKSFARAAVLLGASNIERVPQNTRVFAEMPTDWVTASVEQAVDSFKRRRDLIVRQAHIEIDRARKEKEGDAEKRERALVKKQRIVIAPNQRVRLKVNLAGRSTFGVASSLHLNRMRSLGFLHEAIYRGVTDYRIHATLDASTTTVCRNMHGKVFSVQGGYERLTRVLDTENVDDIKSVAPFPDPRNAAELKSLPSTELAARGHETPPYHILCRTVLTLLDRRTEQISTQVRQIGDDVEGALLGTVDNPARLAAGAQPQAGVGVGGISLKSPVRNLIRGDDDVAFPDDVPAPALENPVSGSDLPKLLDDARDNSPGANKLYAEHTGHVDYVKPQDIENFNTLYSPTVSRKINSKLTLGEPLSKKEQNLVAAIKAASKPQKNRETVLWRAAFEGGSPNAGDLSATFVSTTADVKQALKNLKSLAGRNAGNPGTLRLYRIRTQQGTDRVLTRPVDTEHLLVPGNVYAPGASNVTRVKPSATLTDEFDVEIVDMEVRGPSKPAAVAQVAEESLEEALGGIVPPQDVSDFVRGLDLRAHNDARITELMRELAEKARSGGYYSPDELTKRIQELSVVADDLRKIPDAFRAVSGIDDLEDAFRKTLSEDRVSQYMAVKQANLNKIIKDDGRIRSSIETGKGTYTTVGSDRLDQIERPVFNLPESAGFNNPDEIPKYGFMANAERMDADAILDNQYGEVFLKFRSDVRSRSTVTLGDSFDGNTYNKISGASPLNDPNEGLLSRTWGTSSDRRYAYTDDDARKWADSLDYRDLVEAAGEGPYLETQIFGNLTLKDVAEIQIQSKKHAKSLRKALDKAGYKDVKVVSSSHHDRLWKISKRRSEAMESILPEDLDLLGDFWVEKLKDGPGAGFLWDFYDDQVPSALKPYRDRLKAAGGGSDSKEGPINLWRDYFREYYRLKSMGAEGGLPKDHWKAYKKTQAGFAEDVFDEDLLRGYLPEDRPDVIDTPDVDVVDVTDGSGLTARELEDAFTDDYDGWSPAENNRRLQLAHEDDPDYIDEFGSGDLEKAINAYAGAAYGPINKGMREGLPLSDGHSKILKNLIDGAKEHRQDEVVWRGVGLGLDEIDESGFGSMITSTSRDPTVSLDVFDGLDSSDTTLFRIRLAKGTKTIVSNSTEKEVMVMPGASYKVGNSYLVRVGKDSSFRRRVYPEDYSGPVETKLIRVVDVEMGPPDVVDDAVVTTARAAAAAPEPGADAPTPTQLFEETREELDGLDRDAIERFHTADPNYIDETSRDLPDAARDALRFYTGTGYRRMNKNMRNGKELTEEQSDAFKALVEMSKEHHEDDIVWRTIVDSEIDDVITPESFTRSFVSTSRDLSSATGTFFTGELLFRVRLLKGAKTIVFNRGEREVLVMPGASVKMGESVLARIGTHKVTGATKLLPDDYDGDEYTSRLVKIIDAEIGPPPAIDDAAVNAARAAVIGPPG